MITALKTKYNFKTKEYTVEAVFNANVLLVHEGYVVLDDYKRAYKDIKEGKLIDSWPDAKKVAIMAWLRKELEANQASDDPPLDLD